MSARIDWAPEGFVEKVGAALQVDDIQVDRDLREFKRLIQEQGFETGACEEPSTVIRMRPAVSKPAGLR